MSALRAHVRDGRLIMDVPTDLPDGTVLDLVVDDEGDDLSDDEREALDASLHSAWESLESGQVHSASDVLGGLRAKRA